MTSSTPISRSKTAALSRVLDSVPKGYTRYANGRVSKDKVAALAAKFHRKYAVAATPGTRVTRKANGKANSILVLYWPDASDSVEWLLLSTPGSGMEAESMAEVVQLRLQWLGYELVRHACRGRTAWTWRRPKGEQAELYALLETQLYAKQYGAVSRTLVRIARQPGFHGVREQSRVLSQFAQRRGYTGPLPDLPYVQKVSHGDPLYLTPAA